MASGCQACPASCSTGSIYWFIILLLQLFLQFFFSSPHMFWSLWSVLIARNMMLTDFQHILYNEWLSKQHLYKWTSLPLFYSCGILVRRKSKLTETVVAQGFNKTEAHLLCWKHLGRVFYRLGNMNEPFLIFLLGMFSSRQLFALLQAWSHFHWSPWKVSHCFVVTRAGPSMLQKYQNQR